MRRHGGVGDREDRPHQGFEALHWLTERLQPSLLLHGHIHPDETPARIRRLGRTVVRNVAGRHLLDIEPGAGVRRSPAGSRYAR
jgi:Icc-related predicted phosphoesterase